MITRSVSMSSRHFLAISQEDQKEFENNLLSTGWKTDGEDYCQHVTSYTKNGKKGSWSCNVLDRKFWKEAKGVYISHHWVSGLRTITMSQWKAEVAEKRSKGYFVIDETEFAPVTMRFSDLPTFPRYQAIDRIRERMSKEIDVNAAMLRLKEYVKKNELL